MLGPSHSSVNGSTTSCTDGEVGNGTTREDNGEETRREREERKETYVGGDFGATEQPDTLEIPSLLGGTVQVHGAKGILVELLESLEVSSDEVVDHEDGCGQLAVVLVFGPEEGIS